MASGEDTQSIYYKPAKKFPFFFRFAAAARFDRREYPYPPPAPPLPPLPLPLPPLVASAVVPLVFSLTHQGWTNSFMFFSVTTSHTVCLPDASPATRCLPLGANAQPQTAPAISFLNVIAPEETSRTTSHLASSPLAT